jgi:hypothetical protein
MDAASKEVYIIGIKLDPYSEDLKNYLKDWRYDYHKENKAWTNSKLSQKEFIDQCKIISEYGNKDNIRWSKISRRDPEYFDLTKEYTYNMLFSPK